MTSKDINKWADKAMFTAEPQKAEDGVQAYLLGGPVDPLGQIAACAKMYKGEVVRDLAEVTDEERREYLREIQKTVLKMPLEVVDMHFMIEGLHRGISHQMVRQRTAAFAQESMRFAVKEDMGQAVALPPSLQNTLSYSDLAAELRQADKVAGIDSEHLSDHAIIFDNRTRLPKEQLQRLEWDNAVSYTSSVYNKLINDGMPAEEARGLAPTNVLTRLNYKTNLRSWYDTMANRVSDQAQFEWRIVAMAMVQAMISYGEANTYRVGATTRSSAWQWRAIAMELKPVEFAIGGPAFGANFDRPSRIGERVRAFHARGVPSSEWLEGSDKYSIPPLHPSEWLLDPNSARLGNDEEFDVFGNRVSAGTGDHWDPEQNAIVRPTGSTYRWVAERVSE